MATARMLRAETRNINDDYIEIENDIVETLKKVFDKCESFDEIKNEIEKLSLNWDSSKIAEIMASAFFMARAKGDNDFDLDEENDLRYKKKHLNI